MLVLPVHHHVLVILRRRLVRVVSLLLISEFLGR